jgi:DNA-binding NarL/FixJ family response regulator
MGFVEAGVISVLTSKRGQSDLGIVSVRVLLVDDYEYFRSLAASILGRQPGFQIVGEALDGQEAVRKAQELKPDIVVLDIGLPKLHGIEVAERIRSISPDSKILFFTLNDCPRIVLEAFDVGADGYVHKLDTAGELLAAAEAVLLGKRYLSRLAGLTLYAIQTWMTRERPPTSCPPITIARWRRIGETRNERKGPAWVRPAGPFCQTGELLSGPA